MPHLLALDQGTTSSRAIVFDEQGEVADVAQREFKQHYPRSGWVEHDADEIWRTQLAVAEEALASAADAGRDITAIGIANQRETVVLWDRASGEPVGRAIVWQDRRTARECDRLRAEGREGWLTEKTGLIFDPYFAGTKLAWLLDNTADARESAAAGRLAAGTIDAWLVYRLTGGRRHVTDATNASRTLLMDIHSGQWDEELLECFGVPREVLPEIVPSSGVCGEVAIDSPLRGLPIAGMAGDQQAALFGQACFAPGLVKNTYGTGCFALMNTGEEACPSRNRLLTTIACRIADKTEYALEGSIFTGGAVVGWLRDGLGVIKESSEVEALAGSVSDSGGVYLVPAFAGLGAPHWDAYARGTIVGITGGTTAAHLARAALDSIALQSADLIEALRADSATPIDELRVDGGACVDDLLMQRQADLLQTPVVRPAVTETTALGAAYLAGLAVGVWPDRSAVTSRWRADRRFEPAISADEAHATRAAWSRAVERSLGWAAGGDGD
ncbi:glycerol kinase GlpK [Botrimarina sp.]|uniref:glycerol kinase GlpK n=1 Tax=Botrimarina sp. TaxID=2795802 RepID=UPI0032ED3E6D